jgi:hypothetical protein
MHDLALQRLDPCSITYQLAVQGLLPDLEPERAAAAVIDLSNGPDDHRPHQKPRKKPRRKPRPGMPVLPGTASESGRKLIVWCPFCGEHAHGRHGACEPGTCDCPLHAEYTIRGRCTCPVGSGDGHRVAHCTRDTPFRATGYYVQEVDR